MVRSKGEPVWMEDYSRVILARRYQLPPLVQMTRMMLLLIQAAQEGRQIHTTNVWGAYLHAEMDNFVVIKLQGQIVDILCEMKPEYKNLVVYKNGKATVHMQLMKALYGCIKSVLLWYKLSMEN